MGGPPILYPYIPRKNEARVFPVPSLGLHSVNVGVQMIRIIWFSLGLQGIYLPAVGNDMEEKTENANRVHIGVCVGASA